jgi:hypothetical protein
MDTLQFRVLPLGSLIAVVTIVWLALGIWRRRRLSDVGWATLSGIVGGAALLSLLVYVR